MQGKPHCTKYLVEGKGIFDNPNRLCTKYFVHVLSVIKFDSILITSNEIHIHREDHLQCQCGQQAVTK